MLRANDGWGQADILFGVKCVVYRGLEGILRLLGNEGKDVPLVERRACGRLASR